MAFNNVRKEMSRALDRSAIINETKHLDLDESNKHSVISKKTECENLDQEEMSYEKTKAYPFTLQPSVREKIKKLAKESGAKSSSSYLNEYFKKL